MPLLVVTLLEQKRKTLPMQIEKKCPAIQPFCMDIDSKMIFLQTEKENESNPEDSGDLNVAVQDTYWIYNYDLKSLRKCTKRQMRDWSRCNIPKVFGAGYSCRTNWT